MDHRHHRSTITTTRRRKRSFNDKWARCCRRAVDFDLAVVWWFRRNPVGRRIALPFRHVISRHPVRDISAVTWLVAGAGAVLVGFRFAVSCALNLGTCLFLRCVIGARRPVDYDAALKQLADRGPDPCGFPSVETHVAVVVYWSFFASLAPSLWPLAVTMIALVAMSRVVAGSRFAHQVLGSVATGTLGLSYGKRLLRRFRPWRSHWHDLTKNRAHTLVLVVLAFLAVAYVAYCAEANTSHLFSVPNAEFTRVLRSVYGLDDRPSSASPKRKSAPHRHQRDDSLALLTSRLRQQRDFAATTGV